MGFGARGMQVGRWPVCHRRNTKVDAVTSPGFAGGIPEAGHGTETRYRLWSGRVAAWSAVMAAGPSTRQPELLSACRALRADRQ